MEALDYWVFAVAVLSTPAFARVNVNFDVEVAPPPPRVEAVLAPRPGYVWAPGYWAWEGKPARLERRALSRGTSRVLLGAGALSGVSWAKRSALAFRAWALGAYASASLLITSRPCR